MKRAEEVKDSPGEVWNTRKEKTMNRTVVKDGTRCRVFGKNLRNYCIFSKMIWGIFIPGNFTWNPGSLRTSHSVFVQLIFENISFENKVASSKRK